MNFMNYRYFIREHSAVLACVGLFLVFFLLVYIFGAI